MTQAHARFAGSIPEVYDACLGPLLFEFSAADLARRVASAVGEGTVLEIACGTGISTEYLRRELPSEVEIVATDVNPAMLDFARARRGELDGVRYDVADGLALPYDAGVFDAVICQFGIMFFPDCARGLAEMRRVLRPGGLVACNVWDSFETNPVAGLAHETIARHFDSDPPTFLKVPFGSCELEPTRNLFRAQGFEDVEAHAVEATIERPSALEVARGFVEGNPGVAEIRERSWADPETIVRALAEAIERELGPEPLRLALREIVFTGRAPSAG
jgi:ubiquinone/menaquinone biosynthesis C-methylase UbiE